MIAAADMPPSLRVRTPDIPDSTSPTEWFMSEQLNLELNAVEDRVEAGMAWLDETYPGWDQYVNPWSLDMDDGSRCVLGQLATAPMLSRAVQEYKRSSYLAGWLGYTVMADMHDMTHEMTRDMGFVGSWDLMGEQYRQYVSALESAWVLKLISREGARLAAGLAVSDG